MTISTRTIAVTSGKGGVGKSCIALNLSVALASRGQRVLLIDADLGLGNLGLLVGISPVHTIETVLNGQCTVAEAIVEGLEGWPSLLALLPAASGSPQFPWPIADFPLDICLEIGRVFDFIVVDTGAGVGAKVVDFAAAADELLVAVTPEPTSIADSYAALKVILQRRPDIAVNIVVNMVESLTEGEDVQEKFAEIVERFLGAQIDNRSYIPLDRYVREAAKRQTPFALANPPTPAGAAIDSLAGQILNTQAHSSGSSAGFLERVLQLHQTESTP
jgi:flagellar biosynthesis protein FlhG